MDFSDKDWRYINEGNAHIVLQVLGTDYVLRLIKEDGNPVYFKAVQESVDFVNFLMLPLLSANNHHLQDIVKIPAEKLAASANKFSHLRPEERKYYKSVLSQYAIKDLNLTILSPNSKTNYCVEIKPKEGFISAKFQKLSKCYYCLKQFLKLHQNEIVGISSYCPVDLFSGDWNRMKYALKSLILNPQNNFKLFKDGNIIYSDKLNTNDFENIMKNIAVLGNSEMFVTFIVGTLLNDKNYIMLEESKAATVVSKFEKKKTICAEENNLKHDNFLYKLLYVQRLSENLDFTIEDKKCTGFEYVEAVVNRIKTENINFKLESDMKKFLSTTDPKVIALISAIAKDCSIMISFSTDIEERFSTIQIGEYKISYKVSVTDLEPKAAKTLAKRLKTEKQLIEIYEKHLNSTCK